MTWFIVLWIAGVTRADEVRLKNGNVLRGEILKKDPQAITLRLYAGAIETIVPTRNVARILRRPKGRRGRPGEWTIDLDYGGPSPQDFARLKSLLPSLMDEASEVLAEKTGLRNEGARANFKPPLPWRERVGVRGDRLTASPHPNLLPQGEKEGFEMSPSHHPIVIQAVDRLSAAGESRLARAIPKYWRGQPCWVIELDLTAYREGKSNLEETLLHEYTHAVMMNRLGLDAFGALPFWVREGSAEFVSGTGAARAIAFSQGAGRHLPGLWLRPLSLSPQSYPETQQADYTEGYLAFQYISEKLGERPLKRLFEKIVSRVSFERVVQDALEMDWPTFQKRSLAYMQEFVEANKD